MLGSVFVAVDFAADDSDAADSTTSTEYWICYGRILVFEDENYNPSTYNYICWQVSENYSDLHNAVKHETAKYETVLSPEDYPSYETNQIYACLTTVINGEQIVKELTVRVNPVDDVCYVLFMYDDEHGYKYQPVTSTKSVNLSREYVVDVPEKDPMRTGFKFKGWFMDKDSKVPFSENTVVEFMKNKKEVVVYPKWETDISQIFDFISVNFQQINGVDYVYDSLIVEKGKSFMLKMNVFEDYRVDLSEIKAVVIDGDSRTTVNPTFVSESSCTFEFKDLTKDLTVVFNGYVSYVRVVYSMGDGITVDGAQPEWVKEGSPLKVSFSHESPGADIKVYRNGENITSSSVDGDSVYVSNASGTLYIFAEPSESKSVDEGFPMYLLMIIAVIVVAIIGSLIYIHNKNQVQ